MMPRITRPQVYRVVREMLPRERFGPAELLRWLEETQDSNERARRSHAKRRSACGRDASGDTPAPCAGALSQITFSGPACRSLSCLRNTADVAELLFPSNSIHSTSPSLTVLIILAGC